MDEVTGRIVAPTAPGGSAKFVADVEAPKVVPDDVITDRTDRGETPQERPDASDVQEDRQEQQQPTKQETAAQQAEQLWKLIEKGDDEAVEKYVLEHPRLRGVVEKLGNRRAQQTISAKEVERQRAEQRTKEYQAELERYETLRKAAEDDNFQASKAIINEQYQAAQRAKVAKEVLSDKNVVRAFTSYAAEHLVSKALENPFFSEVDPNVLETAMNTRQTPSEVYADLANEVIKTKLKKGELFTAKDYEKAVQAAATSGQSQAYSQFKGPDVTPGGAPNSKGDVIKLLNAEIARHNEGKGDLKELIRLRKLAD
jgi:hypothetical protein